MGRYKSRELIHFGVDYVKCQIAPKGDKLHRKLRLSANSNFVMYDKDTIIELLPHEASKITKEFGRFFQIRDRSTGVNIAFVGIGGASSGAVKRSDFLEVTGQGLVLRGGYRYFVDMMDRLDLSIVKYIRVDVCMDIWVDTQYLIDYIITDAVKGKTKTPFYTKGIVHALYIGEKQLAKNTYQFMRIYNKKLDSSQKEKEWLYWPEYKNHPNITRLEVEIRRDKACFLTTAKLLSVDYLFGVCVRTFYPLNNQFFGFLALEDFKKVEETGGIWKKRIASQARRREWQELYGKSFRDDKEFRQWKATFVSYAKRLYSNGMTLDDIDDLIRANIEKNDRIDNVYSENIQRIEQGGEIDPDDSHDIVEE